MSDNDGPHHDATMPLSAADLQLLAKQRTRRPALMLLIYEHGVTRTEVLAERGGLVVGRDEPADIVIADATLSRRHARLTREGDRILVEDLASTNGTRVNGTRVERAHAGADDELQFGGVSASVLAPTAQQGLEEGLLGHDSFSELVRYETARCRELRGRAALLMLAPTRRETSARPAAAWWRAMRVELRAVDRLALYGQNVVELILPQADEAEAIATARRLIDACAARVELACGAALLPNSATSAESLVQACRSALGAARRRHRGEDIIVAEDRGQPQRDAAPDQSPADEPVVASATMRELYEIVERVAPAAIPVLIQGETGAGKELVAAAIHRRSNRHGGPLCSLNCGAIPRDLVESALFGHEKGAFTGAAQRREGVFEAADGGTVFLDEIGELSSEAQVALLRVLETKRLTRVGGRDEIAVDVRIVAATHRDLEQMVSDGEFRLDLFYRLNTMMLRVPPLRERREEIAPLARRFMALANEENGRSVGEIAPLALRALERHVWPGNVRELRNAIDRAVVIAGGDTITLEDLPERVRALGRTGADPSRQRAAPPSEDRPQDPPQQAGLEALLADALRGDEADVDFKTRMQRLEAQLIVSALEACDYNQTETSRRLRIPLRTLVNKVRQYDLSRPDE
ncbi:MAG: sigma 54-interacting transcriptional regulator [Myxococcales bacterium]|nr:sigma 54-interacting transcriptional regulator [Myxococcales bacterium]